jgi:hypothetical protein
MKKLSSLRMTMGEISKNMSSMSKMTSVLRTEKQLMRRNSIDISGSVQSKKSRKDLTPTKVINSVKKHKAVPIMDKRLIYEDLMSEIELKEEAEADQFRKVVK